MRRVLVLLLVWSLSPIGVVADFYANNKGLKDPLSKQKPISKVSKKTLPSIQNGVLKWGDDPFKARGLDRSVHRKRLEEERRQESQLKKKSLENERAQQNKLKAEAQLRDRLEKEKKKILLDRSLYYKVVAIWKTGKGYKALIANRVIEVGSWIQDAEVTHISTQAVILKQKNKPAIVMKVGELYRDIF